MLKRQQIILKIIESTGKSISRLQLVKFFLFYSPTNKDTENRHNEHSQKTVRSEFGDVTLQIPRDRESEFDPVVVKKHQKMSPGLKIKSSPFMLKVYQPESSRPFAAFVWHRSPGEIESQIKEVFDGIKITVFQYNDRKITVNGNMTTVDCSLYQKGTKYGNPFEQTEAQIVKCAKVNGWKMAGFENLHDAHEE